MPARKPFNAFRNGVLHVNRSMCETCVYKPGTALYAEDACGFPAPRVGVEADKANTGVICHHTLNKQHQAICFGSFQNGASLAMVVARHAKATKSSTVKMVPPPMGKN